MDEKYVEYEHEKSGGHQRCQRAEWKAREAGCDFQRSILESGETANEGGKIERAHDTNWCKNITNTPMLSPIDRQYTSRIATSRTQKKRHGMIRGGKTVRFAFLLKQIRELTTTADYVSVLFECCACWTNSPVTRARPFNSSSVAFPVPLDTRGEGGGEHGSGRE